MDNLTRDCVRAMKLGYGFHYGAYKAAHPKTKPEPVVKAVEPVSTGVCLCCGNRLLPPKVKYCSEECGWRYRSRLRSERRQNRGKNLLGSQA